MLGAGVIDEKLITTKPLSSGHKLCPVWTWKEKKYKNDPTKWKKVLKRQIVQYLSELITQNVIDATEASILFPEILNL